MDLHTAGPRVPGLDIHQVQLPISVEINHLPHSVVLGVEGRADFLDASLVVRCARGDMHLYPSGSGIASLDVDQVEDAIAVKVGHLPGPVVFGQESRADVLDAGLEVGRRRGNVHLHSAGACVAGLDVHEVITAITVGINQLPDAIVFGEESRAHLQRAGLVVGGPGGEVDFHLAGAGVAGFDVGQIWTGFVGRGSQGPGAVGVWSIKGSPRGEDAGLVWSCCGRGSQQRKNEMPDGV